MGYRADMDSATGLVDTMIGSAYPVVREVATNIEYVKHVSAHMEQILDLAASVPGIMTILADHEARILALEATLVSLRTLSR